MNRSDLRRQMQRRNPLPPGTPAVAAGLVIAGITAYAFLAVSSRALGPERYTPLALLWALVFVAGPGFFLPLEQELGRALSARRVRGEGGAPLIKRAALAGGTFTGLTIALAFTVGRNALDRIFNNEAALVAAFVLALAAYCAEYLVRGTLSGNARFVPYGALLAVEGSLRALIVVVLALLGVRAVGAYGFVIGGGTLLTLALVLRGQHGLARQGSPPRWSELSQNMVTLILASVLAQFLVNAAPLGMELLAKPNERSEPGVMLNALVIARAPLFFFQAVQAALLPRLATLAAEGRFDEFRRMLIRLLLFIGAVGTVATTWFFMLGPFAVRILFGRDFIVSHSDMGYLALASAVYMICMAMAQALIALDDHLHTVVGWGIGVAAFLAVLSLDAPIRLRAERALLVATLSAAVAMGFLLATRIRSDAPAANVPSRRAAGRAPSES